MRRILLTMGLLMSSTAWACAVCGTPSEQGQGAYLFMTGVLSLLPLALLGGVIAWVFLRSRRAHERSQRP